MTFFENKLQKRRDAFNGWFEPLIDIAAIPPNYFMKNPRNFKTIAVLAGLALTVSSASAVTLLTEDWEDAGWSGTDINANTSLHDLVGYGLNQDNPTTLNGAGVGGNVLRDQGGFGGVYGSAVNSGNAVRVRSSNGAMLNRSPLALSAFDTVTFSFDLKANTANYVHVVEFSTNQAFTAPILLDTFDGNSDLGLWLAKSYTLTNGVDATFTDDSYFRVRKLRPNPAGTNGGSNPTSFTYDNLLIEAESLSVIPEPSSLALLGLGGIAILLRRRK